MSTEQAANGLCWSLVYASALGVSFILVLRPMLARGTSAANASLLTLGLVLVAAALPICLFAISIPAPGCSCVSCRIRGPFPAAGGGPTVLPGAIWIAVLWLGVVAAHGARRLVEAVGLQRALAPTQEPSADLARAFDRIAERLDGGGRGRPTLRVLRRAAVRGAPSVGSRVPDGSARPAGAKRGPGGCPRSRRRRRLGPRWAHSGRMAVVWGFFPPEVSLAMKFAAAAPLFLALAPTVTGQSSVVRPLTSEFTDSDQDLAQAGYPRDLLSVGATFPVAPGFFGLPALDGVRPIAVEFDFESQVVVRASLTNSQSIVVEDGLIAGDVIAEAAGASDTYGPLSRISSAALGNNFLSETFQPGETRVVEMFPLNNIVPTLLSIRYEPDSLLWCFFETACPDALPGYICQIVVQDVGPWTGDCDVNWCEARAEHTNRVTVELALDEATTGVRPFCGPTGTLAPVELRAFGSLAAGTDWLSMRVEGVPAGAPVAVVGASRITAVVASSLGICIGGDRLSQSVVFADDTGTATNEVSLGALSPGDRVAFQALYRTPTAWDVSTGLLVEVQ